MSEPQTPPAATPQPVVRVDVRDWLWDMITEKTETTDEGFLRGRAVLTNVGVFPYLMADGSIRQELRLPDEVFDEESLKSLRGKPITLDHPMDGERKVNPENAKDLVVGAVGDRISQDGYRVAAQVSIFRNDAVSAVQNGKRALSCGYNCEVEPTAGVWMGVRYDAIQRKIRYNHVALVDRGRAGDDAVLRMDAAAGISHQTPKKESTMTTPNQQVVNIDGASFNADAAVVQELTRTRARADKAEADLQALTTKTAADVSRLEGERDSARARADKAEADLKAAQDGMPAQIAAAVAKRATLTRVATDAGVEFTADTADADLEQAVVLKAIPKADTAKMAAEPLYRAAMFDAAVGLLAAMAPPQTNADAAAQRAQADRPNADTAPMTADAIETAAYNKMREATLNAYKGSK